MTANSASSGEKPATGDPPAASRAVTSSELFGTQREIIIQHEDAVYRLRITKSGKLILTK
jgi:hemin uptake protein HemP